MGRLACVDSCVVSEHTRPWKVHATISGCDSLETLPAAIDMMLSPRQAENTWRGLMPDVPGELLSPALPATQNW